MKLNRLIPENILLIFSLLICIGSFSFFSACPVHDDTIMACHWAQNAVTLSGIVLAALALIRIVVPNDNIKTGISIGIFALSAAVIFIPGTTISLCMMDDMACHTTFKPAVIVVSAVLAVIALADVIAGFVKANEHIGGHKKNPAFQAGRFIRISVRVVHGPDLGNESLDGVYKADDEIEKCSEYFHDLHLFLIW